MHRGASASGASASLEPTLPLGLKDTALAGTAAGLPKSTGTVAVGTLAAHIGFEAQLLAAATGAVGPGAAA